MIGGREGRREPRTDTQKKPTRSTVGDSASDRC